MTIEVAMRIELEPGEVADELAEARAVQRLQDAFAQLARQTPDELAALWRAAPKTVAQGQDRKRTHHDHGPRRKRS